MEEDFANGRFGAEFVEPIRLNWRGLDVWQCPPNGPGLVALMILGQLEALGPCPDARDGATRHHWHIEAARLKLTVTATPSSPTRAAARNPVSRLLAMPGLPRRLSHD